MRVSCESMAKVKRKRYYQRWREQHPLFQMYLTKEQYEAIKKLADSQNKTMKDVVLEAIKGLVDFEKIRREYEIRVGELSKELSDKEAMVSQLKARVDALKKILNGVYDCIITKKREVCESVCIDVHEVGYELNPSMYGAYMSAKVTFDVDTYCLKRLFSGILSK